VLKLTVLAAYMKTVKEKLKEKNATEEEISTFEKGAQAYAKKIVANFKDYDFYIGESMNPDGMYVYIALAHSAHTFSNDYFCRVVLMNYREDGVTPYITVWKHGLTKMKV
jgi:hypothetical protein